MSRPGAVLAGLALVASVTTGCHDPTDVAQFVDVHVDGTLFTRNAQGLAEVPFSVVNPGDDTVYVSPCGVVNPEVDRWQDARWTQYGGGVCMALAQFPQGQIVLAPGAQYSGTTELDAAGQYRLRIGAGVTPSSPTNRDATSNAFDVQ